MKLSLNDVFNNSFMISCDKNRQHLEELLFKYHDLPFPTIFNGQHFRKKAVSPVHEAYISLLGYAKAYKMPYLLCFEDDVYPSNGVKQKFQEYLQDIPDDAGFIQYCWSRNDHVETERISKYVHTTKNVLCAAAFLIFENAYDAVIEQLLRGVYVDRFQPWVKGCYTSSEMLFSAYNFQRATCGNIGFDNKFLNEFDRQYFNENYVTDIHVMLDKLADKFHLHRNELSVYES